MSLNWVEIDRVLEELSLEGSFLQGVRQSDYHHVLLDFYRPASSVTVLISLAAGKTRLHAVVRKPKTLKKPPRFVEFLRSQLVGSRVAKAYQVGKERIVALEFDASAGKTTLWIRLWGGAANVLATNAGGKILEAAFRRPASGEVQGGRFDPVAAIESGTFVAKESGKTFAIRDLPDPEGEEGASYNRRLEVFYQSEATADVETLRDQALRLVERRLSNVDLARERAEKKRKDYARQDDWKAYADLIVSEAHRIKKGDVRLVAVDFRDERQVQLDLDPKLTPWENAQVFYKKYQKSRDGIALVQDELRRLDAEEKQWFEARDALATADHDALTKFLAQHRSVRQAAAKDKDDRPGLEFFSGNFRILVGRNAKENDALLRRYTRGNDLWMHTRDVPGGYVFVKTIPGKTVPLETLLDAGNLAVWYSKAKSDGKADLYYTAVKYLRRAKDAPLGTVLPTHEKNLTVSLEAARLERLKAEREDSP